jgi:hypothetical protein
VDNLVPPCTSDPDLWFAETKGRERTAKAICQACPLRRECLEVGLTEEHGTWGGLSREDRENVIGKAYAIGGRKSGWSLKDVYCPNCKTGFWSLKPYSRGDGVGRWPQRGATCTKCGFGWKARYVAIALEEAGRAAA